MKNSPYAYHEEIDGEDVTFDLVEPEPTANSLESGKADTVRPILVAKLVSGGAVLWEGELPWVVAPGVPIEQQVSTARLREMYRWERRADA